MSRREAWLSAGAVFLVALAVRTVAAAAISFPIPEGTAYYPGVARNLLEGRGLVTIENREFPLAAPAAIIMPADKPHGVLAPEKFKMLLTMIRAK